MRAVFADTSYFVALLFPNDENHREAQAYASALRLKVVTTDWVLLELANFCSQGSLRNSFLALLHLIRQSVVIERAHPGFFDAGLALYAQRLDKEWSLVDCISFLSMERHNIRDALTTDHHFTQAGFNMLLQ